MEVRDTIVQNVQKIYGYEVASPLRDLEEYGMEGERPKIIMSLEANPNKKDTDQIGLDMLYQANIADYIKRSIQFQEKLCNSWEFCRKKFQNSIKTNEEY